MLAKQPQGAVRHPRGYLIVAVRNTLRNVLRRLVPEELDGNEPGLAARPTHDERLFANELLELVRSKLNHWPNRQMAVVTLSYIEAAFYDEPIDPEGIQQIVLDTLGDEISIIALDNQ